MRALFILSCSMVAILENHEDQAWHLTNENAARFVPHSNKLFSWGVECVGCKYEPPSP